MTIEICENTRNVCITALIAAILITLFWAISSYYKQENVIFAGAGYSQDQNIGTCGTHWVKK